MTTTSHRHVTMMIHWRSLIKVVVISMVLLLLSAVVVVHVLGVAVVAVGTSTPPLILLIAFMKMDVLLAATVGL